VESDRTGGSYASAGAAKSYPPRHTSAARPSPGTTINGRRLTTGRMQVVMRETRHLIQWLARRHAEELLKRGELPRIPGYDGARTSGEAYMWACRWTNEEMRARFGATVNSESVHTWEADHIIPVVEGGGECGLENYRTLCLSCHRKETAALAKRRAERRRAAKPSGAVTLDLALDLLPIAPAGGHPADNSRTCGQWSAPNLLNQ
jgi:hypothetical protein